jgi:hypothetical protein
VIHDDGNIDYSGKSSRELQEARIHINPETYPRNFANLMAEFERRGLEAAEPERDQEPGHDDSTHTYSAQAKSPIKARATGFLTLVIGIVWFISSYDNGTYRGKRGTEYTFADDPVLFIFFSAIHASVILMGLMGLIFGSQFYRDVIKGQSSSSLFKRRD